MRVREGVGGEEGEGWDDAKDGSVDKREDISRWNENECRMKERATEKEKRERGEGRRDRDWEYK